MKTILCFGDSNTWGYEPVSKNRYGRTVRWTGVLQQELGHDYEVIAEGCNGRTTVWDDPIEGYKNGKEYLPPCLTTHKPLDLVVIMLGTNDLKKRFSVSAFDIAKSAGVLVSIVQKSDTGPAEQPPKVLLLAPPPLGQLTEFAEMFEGAEEKSRKLGEHYGRVAQELGCEFLDTGAVISSSDLDGIHWAASEHQKLGQTVAVKVHQIVS